MIWIWSWYLNWLQNANTLNLGCPFFSHFIEWNWRPLSLKCWHFEASEDIMTKFKSEGLHIIKIKYWKVSGSGNPPSLIPALRKIAILGLKTGLWQWYNGISVWQLKKSKSWWPFWSYQLNSTANSAHLARSWGKWAGLALLFIW